MALYLFSNGDMPLTETTSKVTTPSLCYYNNGTKYIPLITKTGKVNIGDRIYSYTTVRPTIHTIYNNTEYVVPNDYQVISYDITPGTYSPSTFENLIKSYVSTNGSRTVKNAFTVIVDGQTYDVPAGRAICYTSQYAGNARFVTFSGKQRDSEQFQYKQFSTQGVYCVYWKFGSIGSIGQGNTYNNFSITVKTGIKFS